MTAVTTGFPRCCGRRDRDREVRIREVRAPRAPNAISRVTSSGFPVLARVRYPCGSFIALPVLPFLRDGVAAAAGLDRI